MQGLDVLTGSGHMLVGAEDTLTRFLRVYCVHGLEGQTKGPWEGIESLFEVDMQLRAESGKR